LLIVFDLDGTLVDSHRDLADATNALLADYGAEPLSPAIVASMVGEGAAKLVARALKKASINVDLREALARFLEHYDRRLLATTAPYPGMREVLDALRTTHRLAVLTNKPTTPTVRILDGLGLAPFFDDVIGGDTTYGRKPDPAGLLELIARAGMTGAGTLLVGDSPVDLETARRAGAAICLARYGFGFRFEQDGFRGDESFIDDAAGLLGVIESFRRRL